MVVAPLVPQGPQALEDEVEGLKVIRIPYPRVAKLGGVVLAARLAWLLLSRRRDYAAIHAHIADTMAAVSCLAGRMAGRPVVVKLTGSRDIDGGVLDRRQHSAFIRVLRWSLRHASAYQAISSRIAQLLPVCGFDEAAVRVIPNGVDTTRYRAGAADHGLRRQLGVDDKRVGLFLGRLTGEKALGVLFDAWSRAFRSDDAVALLVVGDGPLFRGLREASEAQGIAHQVLFLGRQTDVRPFLAAADFAVLPSEFEGLSNALLEYMAAGLPVIGSRISGTEDLVRPRENGWLFERNNAEDLERCLREVAASPPETLHIMGRCARRTVEDMAAIPRVAESLAELYGLPLGTPLAAGSI